MADPDAAQSGETGRDGTVRGWTAPVFQMLVGLVLLAAGALLGRSFALYELRGTVEAFGRSATLGSVLKLEFGGDGESLDERRAEFALAYVDSEQALAEMDRYTWDVPVEPTPFVGHAPAPGRHANAVINVQQFRHDGEIAIPKPAGVFRIFLTGGSTAFGTAAPSQDRTISGFLQVALARELGSASGHRYEVVNAASPGWSSSHERVWIEGRLSELAPDLVVSLSGTNDVHWGALGRNVLWFRTYQDQHYFSLLDLVYRGVGSRSFSEVTTISPVRVPPELVVSRLVKNLKLSAVALDVPYVYARQPNLATTGKTLSDRERVRLERWESGFGSQSRAYFQETYRRMGQALADLDWADFHYFDLRGVFDDAGAAEEIFVDGYHFGDRGNQRIAERLYQVLAPLLDPAAEGQGAVPARSPNQSHSP